MTENQYELIAPKLNLRYSVALKFLHDFEVNNVRRFAGFFSQCAHESADFTVKEENLKYSAEGLRRTFPKYFFNPAIAAKYERNPKMIASRVYANRMGNGPEESGDGYTYRGRGFIQLTGKTNYMMFAAAMGRDMTWTMNFISTDDGAFYSALWFWKKNNCNLVCDKEDIRGLTQIINGGMNGFLDRSERYERYKRILLGLG